MKNKKRSLKMYNSSHNLTMILEAMLSNQEFLRLITYLEPRKNPLSDSYPDVKLRDVRKKNINYTPYNHNIVTEQQTYIFVWASRHSFPNTTLSTSIYNVEVVVPFDASVMDLPDGVYIRGEEIAQRIAYELDQQHITGTGETTVVNVENIKLNDSYMMTSVQVQVYNASIKEFI